MMTRRTLAVTLATILVLGAGPVWADHRPGNEVLVGGAISQTGRYAEPAGRQVNSIKLWVDEVNARGGLLGHKIKLILLDDKSDTQTAIKLYEKLITEDEVDVLLAPYSSGITEAVANVNERYKMPFVAYGAASTPIWEKGRKYIFNIVDFAALLQKIRASGAEAIFSNSYFADAAAQLRQLREQNINLKLFASTVGPGLPNFPEQLGNTAEYVLGYSQWEPLPQILKHPGMKEFIEAYEKRYGEKPNYHAGTAYSALQVTEAALKKAGSFDNEKLREALASIEVHSVFGRYKVDAKGLNNHEGLTFQILRGQRKVVWPEKWAETKPELPMPEWSKR